MENQQDSYSIGNITGIAYEYKLHVTKVVLDIVNKKGIGKTLIVGCGDSIEVYIFHKLLNNLVIGIDLYPIKKDGYLKDVDIRIGDATSLEFYDGKFDFVYSYHVLEHIKNYNKALSEIYRVLKKNGCFFVGVPNRSRLLGCVFDHEFLLRERYSEILMIMKID